jgi:hypothetical protein
MIEMHFAIFVLLAFLLYYRDIWPIVAGAGLIAMHHLGFNYLQVSGAPVFVFELHTGLDIVMVHAAFVVIETIVLLMIARQLGAEGRQAEALYDALARITADPGSIDLQVRVVGKGSQLTERFNMLLDAISGALGNARDAALRLAENAAELKRTASATASGAAAQQASRPAAARRPPRSTRSPTRRNRCPAMRARHRTRPTPPRSRQAPAAWSSTRRAPRRRVWPVVSTVPARQWIPWPVTARA